MAVPRTAERVREREDRAWELRLQGWTQGEVDPFV
jgi:hypothetical protein